MTESDAKKFLKSLVGRWRTTLNAPVPMSGTCENTAIGDNWIALDSVAQVGGAEVRGRLLLGFDPAEGGFSAAGVNSAAGAMTRMNGRLASSTTLVLDYPGAARGGETGKKAAYRDVTTIENERRYTVATYVEEAGGGWAPIMLLQNERIE